MERMRRLLRADDVVARVRQDIADGVYRPGDELPEPARLAAELGVLDRAVESAYRQLTEVGAVVANLSTGGMVVADPTLDPTVRDLLRAVAAMQQQLDRLERRVEELNDRVDTVSHSVREARIEAVRWTDRRD